MTRFDRFRVELLPSRRNSVLEIHGVEVVRTGITTSEQNRFSHPPNAETPCAASDTHFATNIPVRAHSRITDNIDSQSPLSLTTTFFRSRHTHTSRGCVESTGRTGPAGPAPQPTSATRSVGYRYIAERGSRARNPRMYLQMLRARGEKARERKPTAVTAPEMRVSENSDFGELSGVTSLRLNS